MDRKAVFLYAFMEQRNREKRYRDVGFEIYSKLLKAFFAIKENCQKKPEANMNSVISKTGKRKHIKKFAKCLKKHSIDEIEELYNKFMTDLTEIKSNNLDFICISKETTEVNWLFCKTFLEPSQISYYMNNVFVNCKKIQEAF